MGPHGAGLGETAGPGGAGRVGSECGDAGSECCEAVGVDAVAGAGAFGLSLDEACVAQDAQVFGDGRLGEGELGDDVAGDAGVAMAQESEDGDA